MRSLILGMIPAVAALALACDSPASPPDHPLPVDTTVTTPVPKTQPIFENGAAQPVAGFSSSADWIREELWVETEFDSDGDGRRDRMHVNVTRQLQTRTEGLKVPVVYVTSPYFAGQAPPSYWDVAHEPGATPPPRAPGFTLPFSPIRPLISTTEVTRWLPRGFAVVHSEAPGTGLSEGCVTIGGEIEGRAAKAVIDWLNGRAKGYTTLTGSDTISASWSTGRVGMSGVSYNATLAIAAAATGVQGLEAVIPAAPLTSWYHYYRANGLVRAPGGFQGEDVDVMYDLINTGNNAKRAHCDAVYRESLLRAGHDRVTGDYNSFWASRDMVPNVSAFRAATLLVHGLADWNVMPSHSIDLYEALKSRGVPVHLFLHHLGHVGSPSEALSVRWFTRFLYGVQNGVENGPRVQVVRSNADISAPIEYADYPHPSALPVTLRLRAGGDSLGGLVAGGVSSEGVEMLVDDASQPGNILARPVANVHRLLYATSPLTAPLHISGWPRVTIRVAASKAAANLSVWLVELSDSSSFPRVITRGWADPQNAASLTGARRYTSSLQGIPLTPGEFRNLTFFLEPDDDVVPAGARIGVMIFSSDRDHTLRPPPGTVLTIDLAATSLVLPVVGGNVSVH